MELYDYFDSKFVLSRTQQSLFQDSHNNEMVNEILLDGLLRLLDVSTAVEEALSTMKKLISKAFNLLFAEDVGMMTQIMKSRYI